MAIWMAQIQTRETDEHHGLLLVASFQNPFRFFKIEREGSGRGHLLLFPIAEQTFYCCLHLLHLHIAENGENTIVRHCEAGIEFRDSVFPHQSDTLLCAKGVETVSSVTKQG